MKQLTAKEVETMLNENKDLNLVDVREVDEVAAGKIPGAIHIPLGLLEFRMQELDKSKRIYHGMSFRWKKWSFMSTFRFTWIPSH